MAGHENMQEITSDRQLQSALTQSGRLLMWVTAPWCRSCREQKGVMRRLSSGRNAVEVNSDNYPEVVSTYGIRSLPALVIFDEGQHVRTVLGGGEREWGRAIESR